MMKKVNNKKTVLVYMGFLVVLMVFFILVGVSFWIMKPVTFYEFCLSICVLAFIIVFYIFLRLKIFEYEDSVSYLSIKQNYYWKINGIISPIEFPNDLLVNFSIHKNLFYTSIKLGLKIRGNKVNNIKISIAGLKNRQISELRQSLQNAKQHD